jgi:outer membrane protein assembly factor BamA
VNHARKSAGRHRSIRAPGARRVLASCAAVALAALVSTRAPARADLPATLRDRPVVDVVVEGDARDLVDPGALGVPVGAPLTRALLRRVVSDLLASGRWTDVQVDAEDAGPEGARLRFMLVPRITLVRIDFSGNRVMGDDDLLRVLGVGPESAVEREGLEELARRVVSAYTELGYTRARVRVELRDTEDPGRKLLIVSVAEGPPLRMRGLRFLGERPSADAMRHIVSALEMGRGDVVDLRRLRERVRAAESELRRRGWLAADLGTPEVREEAGGAVLELRASIGPRYAVVLRGHAPLTRSAIAAVLDLGAERVSGSSGERMLAERVADLFERHGFVDVAVDVRTEHHSAERATLWIVVHPGSRARVTSLSFPGAAHFEADRLRGEVVSYLESDVPGATFVQPVDSEVVDRLGLGGERQRRRESRPPFFVEPATVYYPPAYEKALEHIAEMYRAEGYLSVRVGPLRLMRAASGSEVSASGVREVALAIEVPIDEGPRTFLFDVGVRGNTILGDRALLAESGLSRNAPFSWSAIEDARLRMEKAYDEVGYLYATVEPEAHFSDDRTRATVLFRVTERFPVRVREIRFRGLTRTRESVVRNRLALREGDLFRPSEARRSEERLLELGIFSGVTVAPEDPDLPARDKTLIVTVTERKSQYLDTTLGVSTGQGVRAGLEYGYRNLLGRALTTSLRVRIGYQFFLIDPIIQAYFDALPLVDRLERQVTLSLQVPHVPGLPEVRTSVEASHVRHNERQFGYDKNSGVITLAWRPARQFTLTTSAELENVNLGLFGSQELAELRAQAADDPRLSRLLRVPSGVSTLVSTRATASLDLRDSPFTPSRGFYASIGTEWARTLQTGRDETGERFFSHFLKVSLTSSGYVPLGAGVVLALQARAGRVVPLQTRSETYPNRQFFLGGVDTLRGYLQDALVPAELAETLQRDLSGRANPNAVFRGGDAFVLLRAELRFPLVGIVGGGVFVDAGNVWVEPTNMTPLDLRPTAGLGLRLATPVGPLAFDYGFILLRRTLAVTGCSPPGPGGVVVCATDVPFEPVGAFHFSIGLY